MVLTKVPQKSERGRPQIYQDFEGFLFFPWVQTQIYLSTMMPAPNNQYFVGLLFCPLVLGGFIFAPYVQGQIYLSAIVLTKDPLKFERSVPHFYQDRGPIIPIFLGILPNISRIDPKIYLCTLVKFRELRQ